ncbi:hypothetical protein BDA96_05G219800 [Sorghum bicolor]|uniref:Rx N-terminal domain-containing protein n=1 Tax=Sorghum bicolor TaxID=4558 RepID=A0A921QYS6_SORBI|nr:hypothetical protein BDA96_05G219800 [Sorghum bicolor]
MDAPGALDSFLGRLTTVLVNEAQLLGSVRGDVEFIKDEMESMNGLILHLTEAQHRDHQVRAWMKQVVGLTRDCEGNVELYVHYVGSRPGDDGLLGHLRRVLRFLRTIPVRHRIATRIQELKVRARDVGDRRQRYGVTVPASTTTTNIDVIVDMEPAAKEEEDLGRRSILLYGTEPPYTYSSGEVILLLKYLSLRNTDVTQLPKQIKDLRCLETLDVRQTKVRIFTKKAIVLPLLKHFLAGDKTSVSNDEGKCEESFSAVDMPLGIHRMNNLEILSHVQVTNSSSELTGIAELLKLRKLGVALRGPNAKLSDHVRKATILHKCLRSLSVRFHQQAFGEKHDALTPPNFNRSLNVSGLTSGLPDMIQELHQLVKLTLTETYLKEDGLRILGKLRGLRFLRLQNKAYTESELSFKEEEFQTLKFLLVGATNVTNISFANGAAPKLERIIWSFPAAACVSGLEHIPELRVVELNGDCNPDQVREEIQSLSLSNSFSESDQERLWKLPVFKHNPHIQRQDDRAAASASSSSAP